MICRTELKQCLIAKLGLPEKVQKEEGVASSQYMYRLSLSTWVTALVNRKLSTQVLRLNPCSCAVSPNAHNLHSKGCSCEDCLYTLRESLPLHCLPDLFAVHVVALCFKIQRCSSLIAAIAEGNSIVNSWPGGKGKDGCVEKVGMAKPPRR